MPKVFFGISVILIVILAVVSGIKEQRLNAEILKARNENLALKKEITELEQKAGDAKSLRAEVSLLKTESARKDQSYEALKKISAEQADEIAALSRENEGYAERLRQVSQGLAPGSPEKETSAEAPKAP